MTQLVQLRSHMFVIPHQPEINKRMLINFLFFTFYLIYFSILIFDFKNNLLSISLMLSILKEKTVHMLMLAFSAPFVRLILLHNLFFPPFGVTQANDHITILQVIPRAYITKLNVYLIGFEKIELQAWYEYNYNELLKSEIIIQKYFQSQKG